MRVSHQDNQSTLLAPKAISEIPPAVLECMKTNLQGKSFPFEAPNLTLSVKETVSVGEVRAAAPQ